MGETTVPFLCDHDEACEVEVNLGLERRVALSLGQRLAEEIYRLAHLRHRRGQVHEDRGACHAPRSG
jgi:hypothetical protein